MNNDDKEDIVPRPVKIQTPLAELQLMANFVDKQEFLILKRWARRYAEQMKNKSFTLREEDPQFAIKHTRYVEQAVGMQILIKLIAGAAAELEKLED